MTNSAAIPASLHPFIEKWSCATESERVAARLSSNSNELMDFYHVVLAELDPLILNIGDRKVADLSDDEVVLFQLLMSFVEVSQKIEVFGPEPMDPETYPESLLECLM